MYPWWSLGPVVREPEPLSRLQRPPLQKTKRVFKSIGKDSGETHAGVSMNRDWRGRLRCRTKSLIPPRNTVLSLGRWWMQDTKNTTKNPSCWAFWAALLSWATQLLRRVCSYPLHGLRTSGFVDVCNSKRCFCISLILLVTQILGRFWFASCSERSCLPT